MSKSKKEAAIDDFKNICRNEFRYLLTDFGFQEDHSPLGEFENEFQVHFVRPDLTIVVEGIHYGTAATVYLQDSKKRKIAPIQLNPDFQPNPSKTPKARPTSQIEDVKEEAQLLRQYGTVVLEGDLSLFEAAIEKNRIAWEQYKSRRSFGLAEQEAVEAFKSQNWIKVIETLEPYEDKISGRMAKKLKTARENLHVGTSDSDSSS